MSKKQGKTIPKQKIKEKQSAKSERKLIESIIAKYKPNTKKEKSAQDSIPYKRVFPDGICKVTDRLHTRAGKPKFSEQGGFFFCICL